MGKRELNRQTVYHLSSLVRAPTVYCSCTARTGGIWTLKIPYEQHAQIQKQYLYTSQDAPKRVFACPNIGGRDRFGMHVSRVLGTPSGQEPGESETGTAMHLPGSGSAPGPNSISKPTSLAQCGFYLLSEPTPQLPRSCSSKWFDSRWRGLGERIHIHSRPLSLAAVTNCLPNCSTVARFRRCMHAASAPGTAPSPDEP